MTHFLIYNFKIFLKLLKVDDIILYIEYQEYTYNIE